MHRLRNLFDRTSAASMAVVIATTMVIVSCSSSPDNPLSPSAMSPDGASAAAGIVKATNSPSPTPTPSPDPEGDGRFTGGGHVTQEPEGKITYGLTIHCDGPDPASKTLSNNLEINWGNGQGANNFHLNEHEFTVECSDTIPNPSQPPPFAPLDTLIGTGTGKFNGVDGFLITFTFIDGGEGGAKEDQIAFTITGPGGSPLVLLVPPTTVSGGNLQAHCDQPDKGQCKP